MFIFEIRILVIHGIDDEYTEVCCASKHAQIIYLNLNIWLH